MVIEEGVAKAKKMLSMEEAKANVSEDMKKRLGEIWDNAMCLTPKTAELPENNAIIPLGRPSKKLNEAISNALNDKIKTTEQNITLRQVWHMDDKHGKNNEKFSDQNPITKEIFMLIPDVLENFDKIKEGKRTWKYNKEHRSVLISKEYSDGTVILADAVIDGSKLEIKTMILKKPAEVRPTNAETLSGSLLSPSPADLTAFNQPGLLSQGTQSATQ